MFTLTVMILQRKRLHSEGGFGFQDAGHAFVSTIMTYIFVYIISENKG